MKSRLVTRIVLLSLLALATGAAGATAVLWPEFRVVASVALVGLLALTTALARELTRSLGQSISQISQTLTRLAKGDLDATVPEVGTIVELARMSRQSG